MANTPPAPTGASSPGSWLMVALFLLLFVVSPIYHAFFSSPENELDLVLTNAKVTDVSETNRHFSYHLDGQDQPEYNFREFVAADPAARKGYDEDVGWDSSDLSHYLRLGDRLSKTAHSPLLTVRRGAVVTHWLHYSATPESKMPPPRKIFILDGDTVDID
jgi:hypothetical protein